MCCMQVVPRLTTITLMAPKVCESYQWTAGAVAGRISKTPIYILAEDDFQVCYKLVCGYIELLLIIPSSAVICMCAHITVAVCAIYK